MVVSNKLLFFIILGLFLMGCQGNAAVKTAVPPTILPTTNTPTEIAGALTPNVTTAPPPSPTPFATQPIEIQAKTDLETAVSPSATPSPMPLPSFTPLPPAVEPPTEAPILPTDPAPTEPAVIDPAAEQPRASIVGYSVLGRPIVAYEFGQGPKQIIFVGGIHGGYEWNTIVLANNIIDHFRAYPEEIPESLTVTIIPSANPDGHYLIAGEDGFFDDVDVAGETFNGRFNANQVDLNRNWACKWQAETIWRDQTFPQGGGSAVFSEPETQALSNFFVAKQPQIVVFWHSAAHAVYPSGCEVEHARSVELAGVYSQAASYPLKNAFEFYDITGDAGDWLTTQNIASISIELTNHQNSETARNLEGVRALLNYLQ